MKLADRQTTNFLLLVIALTFGIIVGGRASHMTTWRLNVNEQLATLSQETSQLPDINARLDELSNIWLWQKEVSNWMIDVWSWSNHHVESDADEAHGVEPVSLLD